MSTEENKELVTRYLKESIDVIGDVNKFNAQMDKYYTPDSVTHLADADMNVEQWKGVASSIWNAFSDINITLDDIVAEGDKVVARLTWEGTHKGEWLGVAPTGKKATQTMMVIYRMAGGKIAESWILTDNFSMMIQLGAIPNPYVQR